MASVMASTLIGSSATSLIITRYMNSNFGLAFDVSSLNCGIYGLSGNHESSKHHSNHSKILACQNTNGS